MELLDTHLELAEKIIDGKMVGQYFQEPANLGLRQRNVKEFEDSMLETTFTGAPERSRAVTFHPALSSWYVFLPKEEKVGFYKDFFDAVNTYVQPNTKVVTPLVVGGDWVREVQDGLSGSDDIMLNLGDDANFMINGQLTAIDGKKWDSYAGVMTGEAAAPFRIGFGGHASVGSGFVDTTPSDSLATIWMHRDGINPVEGIAERQDLDEQYRFMLGASFVDVDYPRLCGLKLMADDAERSIGVQLGTTCTMNRTNTEDELLRQRLAFHGLGIEGQSFADVMTGTEASEWKNPGTLIANYLRTGEY